MGKPKDVLTTGEVAKICNVAPRTVSKWFDSGQLRGYRIPGSRDRRIPLAQLVRFMRAHGIPLNALETGPPRVLVLDVEEEFADLLASSLSKDGQFEVQTATSAFEAGALAQQYPPHVILVDVSVPGIDAKQLCRSLRARDTLAATKLIATGAGLTTGQGEAHVQEGFAAYLPKPFEIRTLIKIIDDVVLLST